MPTLAELQASLAQRLTGNPAAENDVSLQHALRALRHKRARAVAQLLPRTRFALGARWSASFAAHANTYVPCGLLYHVDDAWEFALAQSRTDVRTAAVRDLAWLELRYVRSQDRDVLRVRERTGFYVRLWTKPWLLALTLPRRPMLLDLFAGKQI
jgi:hypothetical protein